jgi:IMP cyclohydrolase
MGRSVNSRNRIFEKTNDGIRTKAYDETKLTDPPRVIYSPIRIYKNNIIVTNGDQTDTIHDFLESGKSFEDALRTRTFEPDPPILTPRISGIITLCDSEHNKFKYRLSILKSDDGNKAHALRYFYEYETPESGKGHFIHTYKHNADVPPPFEGEPKKADIPDCIEKFTDSIWDSLNSEFKVSLYVAYINIKSGEKKEKLINKNV